MIPDARSLASGHHTDRVTFDEESRALYDAVAPTHRSPTSGAPGQPRPTVLPGSTGAVARAARALPRDFVIPPERLDTVFRAAIAEARRRTAAHIALPSGESFTLEYVTDKPWSGYNWYQGDGESLIQINTSCPSTSTGRSTWPAHEGYPGHHVYNALLEQRWCAGAAGRSTASTRSTARSR
jgi:hypothetical protein